MQTKEVAADLVNLIRSQKAEEAMTKYYHPDIVSVESGGENAESKGIQACIEKGQWWSSQFEIKEALATDPVFNGDEFATTLTYHVKEKETGQDKTLSEIAVYKVNDGKIVHEKFFMNGM